MRLSIKVKSLLGRWTKVTNKGQVSYQLIQWGVHYKWYEEEQKGYLADSKSNSSMSVFECSFDDFKTYHKHYLMSLRSRLNKSNLSKYYPTSKQKGELI